MAPFLTIRRQEVVELAAPWDPAKVLGDYLDDRGDRPSPALSADQLATLTRDGLLVRLDATHRRMGAMEGELRIGVLNPTTVEVEIDGSATVRWWLRPFVFLFRPGLRHAIERQIDQLIADLEADAEVAAGDAADSEEPKPVEGQDAVSAKERPGSSKGLTWSLAVLTLGGQLIYRRTEGENGPV